MNHLALRIGGYDIKSSTELPRGGSGKLEDILQLGINLLFLAAIILALIYLIYGGIDWIRSEGDKTKVQSAKKKIVYSIIGLVIVLISFIIINFVAGIFGVNNLV